MQDCQLSPSSLSLLASCLAGRLLSSEVPLTYIVPYHTFLRGCLVRWKIYRQTGIPRP